MEIKNCVMCGENMKAKGEYLSGSTVSHCECGCEVENLSDYVPTIKVSGCKSHPKERIVGTEKIRKHWTWDIHHVNMF